MMTEATPSAAPAAMVAATSAGNMKPPTRWSLFGREVGRAAVALVIAMIATLIIVFFVSKGHGAVQQDAPDRSLGR